MSLYLRIFLAYFLILAAGAYFMRDVMLSEVKPGVRQSTEDTLIDMSNLLAELVTEEFINSPNELSSFESKIESFLNRFHQASISSVEKGNSQIRIYITNNKGIVVYDSAKLDEGKDYSRWNDVYLTLQGKYGARSTRDDPNDDFSSVMYVAAPIRHEQEIIGVLTVSKPNYLLQPFIDMATDNIQQKGAYLIMYSVMLALILSYGLTISIRKLANYASLVSEGKPAQLPKLGETELSKLAESMEKMRKELEGKDYVEQYVHSLTHELKSPISAIKGASEIVQGLDSESDKKRFIANIQHEIERMDEMINRLLALVKVEHQETLEKIEACNVSELINEVIASKNTQIVEKSLRLNDTPVLLDAVMQGDRFLLTQALDNLLQNAIDFSPQYGQISIEISVEENICIQMIDEGPGIPDYAIDKVFDRFYSLERPANNKKSNGLGLCFVKQIVELHGGHIQLENNINGGVIARLILPKKLQSTHKTHI